MKLSLKLWLYNVPTRNRVWRGMGHSWFMVCTGHAVLLTGIVASKIKFMPWLRWLYA